VVLTFLRDNTLGTLLLHHPHVREVMAREPVELQKLIQVDETVAKVFPEVLGSVKQAGPPDALPMAKL